jgi:hypothetical protein
MGFFSRLFKSESSSLTIDLKALESLLNSVDFSKGGVSSGFYSNLFDIYTKTFKSDDPKHVKAKLEFKEQVNELSVIYNGMLESGIAKEPLYNFLHKFAELTSKDYELPGVKALMISYWYQPIRKTREDLKHYGNKEIIDSFEDFHIKIRSMSDLIMQI